MARRSLFRLFRIARRADRRRRDVERLKEVKFKRVAEDRHAG